MREYIDESVNMLTMERNKEHFSNLISDVLYLAIDKSWADPPSD